MTRHALKHSYDVASAISQGRREYQEDAMAVDFPKGSDLGYVVLADGMGGHAAGDVASKLVVTEVFSDLKLQSGNPTHFENNMADILQASVHAANACVRDHSNALPSSTGMGTTLVAPVLFAERLYWISIGDSPLFLLRDGRLNRLNEDHSLAPQIDFMAKSGLMSEEDCKNHPDRNCLASGLVGSAIKMIDCPKTPLTLLDKDIIVVASDGLQSLSDLKIQDIVAQNQNNGSLAIVDALMSNLDGLGDPDQDNVALTVIKFIQPKPQIETTPFAPSTRRAQTRLVAMQPAGGSIARRPNPISDPQTP